MPCVTGLLSQHNIGSISLRCPLQPPSRYEGHPGLNGVRAAPAMWWSCLDLRCRYLFEYAFGLCCGGPRTNKAKPLQAKLLKSPGIRKAGGKWIAYKKMWGNSSGSLTQRGNLMQLFRCQVLIPAPEALAVFSPCNSDTEYEEKLVLKQRCFFQNVVAAMSLLLCKALLLEKWIFNTRFFSLIFMRQRLTFFL